MCKHLFIRLRSSFREWRLIDQLVDHMNHIHFHCLTSNGYATVNQPLRNSGWRWWVLYQWHLTITKLLLLVSCVTYLRSQGKWKQHFSHALSCSSPSVTKSCFLFFQVTVWSRSVRWNKAFRSLAKTYRAPNLQLLSNLRQQGRLKTLKESDSGAAGHPM